MQELVNLGKRLAQELSQNCLNSNFTTKLGSKI